MFLLVEDGWLFSIASHSWLLAREQALVFLVLHLDLLELAFVHQVVLTRVSSWSGYWTRRLDIFLRRWHLLMINRRRRLVIVGEGRWCGRRNEFVHDLVGQAHFVFGGFLFVLVELHRPGLTSSWSRSLSNCFFV